MAAADRIHDAVKNALVKDGWTITDDPFTIDYEEVRLFADLGAQRPLGARRGNETAVIEAKSFLSPSAMQDFKEALGQYLVYRVYLEEKGLDHKLWLAIGEKVYSDLFQWTAIQVVLARFEVALLVIDTAKEEVVEWKS